MTEEKNSLIAKLDELQERYDQITEQIADPQVAGDRHKLIALSKEQAKLGKTVTKYKQYKDAAAGIEDAVQASRQDARNSRSGEVS